MRTLVIIRTCERDDFIAFLCYKSFVEIMPDASYIFFAEVGKYKWINTVNEFIHFREHCDNFGGRDGLMSCIKELKHINTEGYDKVIFSDADITLLKNPLDEVFSFGGVQDGTNKRHFSGQMLIYDQWLFDEVVNYEYYLPLIDMLLKEGLSIADDTCMSYVATSFTNDTFDFYQKEYWVHQKKYHLEHEYIRQS